MKFTCFLVSLLFLLYPLEAGEIHLNSGKVIEGRVVSENQTSVTVHVLQPDGRIQPFTYPKSVIKSINNKETSIDIFEKKAEILTPSNPKDYYNLGSWCLENGIPKARDLFVMAGSLSIDLRKDSCIQLSQMAKDPVTRCRYLQLAAWYDPYDRKLREELNNTCKDAVSCLKEMRRELSPGIGYILKNDYMEANKYFIEKRKLSLKDQESLSRLLYDKTGYTIEDLISALTIETGGIKTPCGFCDGTKSIGCKRCNETGSIQCKVCLGKAGFEKKFPYVVWKLPCAFCMSSGKVSCPECSRDPGFGKGKLTCPQCIGTGYEIPAEEKKLRPVCTGCKGTGRAGCSVCSGYGKFPCSGCSGTAAILKNKGSQTIKSG